MKSLHLLIMVVSLLFTTSIFAEQQKDIISPYKGSEKIFDDQIGFESMSYLADESTVKTVDGDIHRKFYSAPKGVTPYEIIKNYEHALKSKGATIIHISKNAYRHTNKDTGERVWFMRDLFTNAHIRHQHYGYLTMTKEAEHYVVAKLSQGGSDIYINVASAYVESDLYYEVVTTVAKAMDMNNVTVNVLNDGIAANGKVAVYDIYFDTGKYELKKESVGALKIIAKYLKDNAKKQFVVVGHTDNVGSFDSNIKLSNNRANSVVKALVSTYGIDAKQLKAYGVGSVAPVTSNSTKDGKARNRRVELVEK